MEEKCVAFLQHLAVTDNNRLVAHSMADLDPLRNRDILHEYECPIDELCLLFYELGALFAEHSFIKRQSKEQLWVTERT